MRPTAPNRPVTVTLADDEAHVLEYVRTVLEFDGFEVLGTAHDAKGAVHLAEALHPDVAIVDLYMPGSGLAAAQAIAESTPTTRVMILSSESDARAVLPLLRSGIDGYVIKGSSPSELTRAVRDIAAGGAYLSPAIAQAAVGELTSRLRAEEAALRTEGARMAEVIDIIDNRRFEIHFQPIVRLNGGAAHAVEALTRFGGSSRRRADEWFAEATDLGLREPLEQATAAAALEELGRLRPELRQTVNVSPDVLVSGQLDPVLDGVDSKRLVLELTEHAPVHDYPALRAALRGWREQGARLAIDDAGGGYASMRHILNLAPDYIKLDVELTLRIHEDPERQALARALIGFAEELGAGVIAEGVETKEQLEMLDLLGAHYVQGYHIGRPLPLDDQPDLLVGPDTIDLRAPEAHPATPGR